jgi:glycosyltransferase involved in cell wall biosynthesis
MMSINPLVSIITPCLNGENYVHRFLDSILAQTYSNIELIFVNDGSTDKTEEVVLSYKQKFEEKGITLKYIYQENKGLGGAINTGLQHVTGEYLCWPDSDDYLEPESVERRLLVFKEHHEVGVVSSDAFVRSADNLGKIIGYVGKANPNRFNENQFELLLKGESQFCSGTHMIKMSYFRDVNPKMNVFPCKRGQNWQLLLPVYYKFKRYYLDEPLYNYISYDTSMSKGDSTFNEKMLRSNEHEEIITCTLESMQIPKEEKEKYVNITLLRYARRRMNIAFDYREMNVFKESYSLLKQNNKLTIKDFLLNLLIHFKQAHYLYMQLKSALKK